MSSVMASDLAMVSSQDGAAGPGEHIRYKGPSFSVMLQSWHHGI